MSIFGSIEKGLSAAEHFLLGIVTKGAALANVFSTFGPKIIGAVSAVFYDVMKTALSVEAQIADASAGNFTGAVQLSPTTLALINQIVTDFKAAEADVVAAFNALGIKA